MESKVKEAVQRKMCGYNCAQAVACTYCEQAGLDEETVKNLTQGFAEAWVAVWKQHAEQSSEQ